MENPHIRRDWGLSMAIIVSVLVIDQIIKIYVKTHFVLHEAVDVTSWFQLLFIENKGMAFGMDFVGTLFLTLFRFAAIILFVVLLRNGIRRRLPLGLLCCIALIIAGAAGNLIDNSLYGLIFSESTYWQASEFVPFGQGYGAFLEGKVVDMFYFPLFTWPDWVPVLGGQVFFNAIFNFADAAISCGAIAVLLFYSRFLFSDKTDKKAEDEKDAADESSSLHCE